MSGWGRGSRLRDAGDQVLALTRWARAQAIASSTVHRLNVDPQTGRAIRIGIEMLVDGIGRNIDHIAGFPLVPFHLILRRPGIHIGDFYITVLVQVVATALQDVEALLGQAANQMTVT